MHSKEYPPYSRVALLILGLITMAGCYNQVSLTGGPRDEKPPILDTLQSFQNNQIHFEKQDIVLYFDEFINLKNASKQILITPPLTYNPKYSGKGKEVKVEFDDREVLKENVTYVVNFGESITDYTEGNEVEDFTLVFSTGDYIDSLSISGTVMDAKTRKASEDYLVLLYESLEDSIVYQEKPFYFARVDKSGNFEIKNLRADTFKVFVLNDQNVNYTYEPGNEEIGFLEEPIILSDTAEIVLTLESFMERQPSRYVSYEVVNKGHIRLEFSAAPDLSKLKLIDSSVVSHLITESSDSRVDFWYQPVELSRLNLSYQRADATDTIQMRINTKSAEALDTLIELKYQKPKGNINPHPNKTIRYTTSRPITTIDTTLLSIIDTSALDTLSYTVVIDSITHQDIHLSADWAADSSYLITWLPGATSDMWGYSNDTVIHDLTIGNPIDYGDIELTINNIPADTSYYIELLEGDRSIDEWIISQDTTLLIRELAPGSYSLRLLEDRNQNKQWDPGNYQQKQQSERIFDNIKMEDLRGNWTLQYTLDIREAINNTQTNDETKDGQPQEDLRQQDGRQRGLGRGQSG